MSVRTSVRTSVRVIVRVRARVSVRVSAPPLILTIIGCVRSLGDSVAERIGVISTPEICMHKVIYESCPVQ